MNEPTTNASLVAVIAALIGAGLALYGTARAARPQTAGQGLAWGSLAGCGLVLLALGAAVRAPVGDGLRAAIIQTGATAIAAALGGLSLAKAEGESGGGKGFARVALFVAWLSLLGLPPTAGFHARLLVYRSLLQADWTGAFAFSLAVGAAGLVAGFSALSLGSPGSLRGGRALVAALLLLALLAAGVYPGLGATTADFVLGAAR